MPAKPSPPPTYTWMRVRDKATGHEYDVAAGAFDPSAHEDMQRYHSDRDPHPPKHRTNLAGQPVTDTQEARRG